MRVSSSAAAAFVATALSAAAQVATVPLGESRTLVLSRETGQTILELSGYFEANSRQLGHRRCVIAVDGLPLTEAQLLSPRTIIQPRDPNRPEFQRFFETEQSFYFPYVEHSGDLHTMRWEERNEYDKWVPLFYNFSETLYFDIGSLVPADATQVRVSIYNNVMGPAHGPGGRHMPPFQVTSLQLLSERPATTEAEPYIVPIWSYLDAHPAAARQAMARLHAADTSSMIRAQILTSFGMLNQMKGQIDAAISHFQAALSHGSDFPEYAEVCYRLLRLTDRPPVEDLPVAESNPGRWADLYNRYLRARRGESPEGLITIHRADSPFVPDGETDDAMWHDEGLIWHPVANQVNGDPRDSGNAFALAWDDAGLRLLFRGPGAPNLDLRDTPGTDRAVWEFNCVEFFVAPDATFTRFYELNVAASGGRFDNRLLWNGVNDPGFDFAGAWRSGASMNAEHGLRVEYHIPWSDFGMTGVPADGALWVANVIRVEHLPDEEGKSVHREYSAGKLLWRHFHRIQDGLILRFVTQ